MAANLQKVSELPRKRKGTLKRIARVLRFPVDEMLPKSHLQRMKILIGDHTVTLTSGRSRKEGE